MDKKKLANALRMKSESMKSEKMESRAMSEQKAYLTLSDKDLPEIKDWQVGQTYTVILTVKQTSLNQNEMDGQQNVSANFEVMSAKAGSQEEDEEYLS